MRTDLEAIQGSPNGAHFVGADLHIHSFGGSRDVTDKAMVPQAIVDEAVKKGLSIIAITDHNNCRNVRAAIEAAKQYDGLLLVLPGVEITTANGHLLAYFATVELVEKLINRLEVIDTTASDGHTQKSMASVLADVEALGGFAVAAHIDREKTGFELYAPGYQSAKRDILKAPALRGLEVDDPTHLMWYSPDDRGPNSAERKQLLGARKSAMAHSALAHIRNSDAHSLAQFITRSIGARIKLFDLTYQAVDVAFRDPAARVVATDLINESYARIVGLVISGGFLDNQVFHFNPNLNCIFGGRGTGKSTALRALAYALGQDPEFEFERDDVPQRIILLVQDEQGLTWFVEAKDADSTTSLASDPTQVIEAGAFQIEYYPQNALSRISQNLTEDGSLLQAFMDRHLHRDPLFEQERLALSQARQLASQLEPLESDNDTLQGLTKRLKSTDKLLKSAEDGKFREVVAAQAALANERQAIATVRRALQALHKRAKAIDLEIDIARILEDNEPLLDKQLPRSSGQWRKAVLQLFKDSNALFVNQRDAIVEIVESLQRSFEAATNTLSGPHDKLQQRIAEKIAEFEKQGLKPTAQGLSVQVTARTKLISQIAQIKERRRDLEECRAERKAALEALFAVRSEIEQARRKQLAPINDSLAQTIDQFRVVFRYDNSGDITNFADIVKSVMHGTFMHDDEIERMCRGISPQELARCCSNNDVTELQALLSNSQIAVKWAGDLIQRFSIRKNFFELETCWRAPIIRLRIISGAKQEIPVKYLSDGQRHTILLTAAMLGNSYLPLVIDQPEDDLDNAFISTTVVDTLRRIKERRQVIVVTHNANIVVLGDAEQIFPMDRMGEHGRTFDVGSIDHSATRAAVEAVLEGGRQAFMRRADLYGII